MESYKFGEKLGSELLYLPLLTVTNCLMFHCLVSPLLPTVPEDIPTHRTVHCHMAHKRWMLVNISTNSSIISHDVTLVTIESLLQTTLLMLLFSVFPAQLSALLCDLLTCLQLFHCISHVPKISNPFLLYF